MSGKLVNNLEHEGTVNRYPRADALRILRITTRQLMGWEKAGLVEPSESYSFFELLQLKKLRDLRAKKVRSAVIRQSLEAMQRQVSGMVNPLLEAGTFSSRTRVAVRPRGEAVGPEAGPVGVGFCAQKKLGGFPEGG